MLCHGFYFYAALQFRPYYVFQDMKPYVIMSFTDCEVTSLDDGKREHCFQVVTKLGKKFVFAADELEEKEKWMQFVFSFTSTQHAKTQTFFV